MAVKQFIYIIHNNVIVYSHANTEAHIIEIKKEKDEYENVTNIWNQLQIVNSL